MILLIGAGFSGFAIGYLIRKKKMKDLFIKPGLSIIFVSILAPILQILFLRNHSVNHEFSMVKIGWIVALFPLIYAVFMQSFYKDDINRCMNGNQKSVSTVCMRFFFGVMFLGYLMGQPYATQDFLEDREWTADYRLEEAIYNIAGYDDMYFSFDIEIGYDDSMALAIAEKCVYQVSDLGEMEDCILKVDEEIDEVFFIIDYQADSKKEDQNEMKTVLLETKEHIYENERYCIIKL